MTEGISRHFRKGLMAESMKTLCVFQRLATILTVEKTSLACADRAQALYFSSAASVRSMPSPGLSVSVMTPLVGTMCSP